MKALAVCALPFSVDGARHDLAVVLAERRERGLDHAWLDVHRNQAMAQPARPLHSRDERSLAAADEEDVALPHLEQGLLVVGHGISLLERAFGTGVGAVAGVKSARQGKVAGVSIFVPEDRIAAFEKLLNG